MSSWSGRLLLVVVFGLAGAPGLAQVQLPDEVTEYLALERIFEVASYSDAGGRYFAVAALARNSDFGIDVWLVRTNADDPEVLFQLSEHGSLPGYMAERRATFISPVRVFDIDSDGHPELFMNVGCECMDFGSDVMVDGASHRAVAYELAVVYEGGIHATYFEPLPADHDLAVHAAYLLGRIHDDPFEPDDPALDSAVEDREFAIDISRPHILEP